MANGLLQNAFGDVLSKIQAGTVETADLAEALERLIVMLTSPLQLPEQLQITWSGGGAAIQINADSAANPVALSFQQNGNTVTVGLGMQSFGLIASALVNRDLCQPSSTLATQALTAVAAKQPNPGTCLGYGNGAYGSGKPSLDQGTMTAGPGETMPNATVSAYQKVANGNIVVEGLLTTPLAAPSDGKAGATTAKLQSWIQDPAGTGNLVDGDVVTITNRDTGLSMAAGKYIKASYTNGEFRPDWAAC